MSLLGFYDATKAQISGRNKIKLIDHKQVLLLSFHVNRSVFLLKRQAYNSEGGLFVVLLNGSGCIMHCRVELSVLYIVYSKTTALRLITALEV